MGPQEARRESVFLEAVIERLDRLQHQVATLTEQKQKQEELFSELGPVVKEVMKTATARLQTLDQQGYFSFGRELLGIVTRVVEGFEAEDVRKLGDAIVSILETARALTQPEVLAIADEAAAVVQNAGAVEPLGIVGMVRATRHDDVQRGMAVLMELTRHVGRAAEAFSRQQSSSPAVRKRARLAEMTAAKRSSRVLGIERARQPKRASEPPVQPHAAAAQASSAVTTIDGVDFTTEGHLAEARAWTPELAQTLATAEAISLTDAHWAVIKFARAEFEKQGASPNIRRLTQGAGLSTKELYALFPKAPARTVARVAGIPKPAGCI